MVAQHSVSSSTHARGGKARWILAALGLVAFQVVSVLLFE